MIKNLFVGFFLLQLLSCKHSNDDLSGSSEINGKVYIQNPYDEESRKLLPNQELFIQKDTAALPSQYLFSAKSDNNGYFNFKYLYDQSYKIHSESKTNTRLDNNILFTVDSILLPHANTELILGPDFKTQNALYIVCKDTAQQAGTIPGDSIYIYTSSVLAKNDSASVTGLGAAYSFTARISGTAFKMNLPSATKLYLNSAITFGNRRLKSQYDTITLNKIGVDTLFLKLK